MADLQSHAPQIVKINPELLHRIRTVYSTARTVDAIVRKILEAYKSGKDGEIKLTLLADADQTFAAAEWRIGRTGKSIWLVSLTSDLITFWVYGLKEDNWGEFVRYLSESTMLPVSTLRRERPRRSYILIDPKIIDS